MLSDILNIIEEPSIFSASMNGINFMILGIVNFLFVLFKMFPLCNALFVPI